MKFSFLMRSLMISLGISGCVFAVPPRTAASQRPLPALVTRAQQQALTREAAARVQQTSLSNSFRQATNSLFSMTSSLLSRVVRSVDTTINTAKNAPETVDAKNQNDTDFLVAYAKKITLDEVVPEILRSNWLTWVACYPYLLWRKGPRETAKIALINCITYSAASITGRKHLIEKPYLLQVAASFALNHCLHTYLVDPFVDGIADTDKNQGVA